MEFRVISLGNSELAGIAEASRILKVLSSYTGPLVVVASALKGTIETLGAAASPVDFRTANSPVSSRSRAAEHLVSILYEKHLAFLASLQPQPEALRTACDRLSDLREDLSRLLGGPRSLPDCRAGILRLGERLSAVCIVAAFSRIDRSATLVEPEDFGRALREAGGAADIGASIPAVLRGRSAAVIPEYYVTESSRMTALVDGCGT